MEGRKIVKVVGRVHSYASIAFAQRRIGPVSAGPARRSIKPRSGSDSIDL